ncbi:MAG: hypothetical protein DYG89_28590 [Caldilinea sp. CFX5]|nr:hypothetical protein [Caldilinea sp. CFX5]
MPGTITILGEASLALQLGYDLQQRGHDVTVVVDQMATGSGLSSDQRKRLVRTPTPLAMTWLRKFLAGGGCVIFQTPSAVDRRRYAKESDWVITIPA